MADKEIKEGDQVSWQWSGGRPGGTAEEVKEQGEIAIQSNKGNTIKKNASPDNPAVHVSRPGNDVVKRQSELDVEKEGPKHKDEGGEGKADKEEKKEQKKADAEEEEKKEAKEEEKKEKEQEEATAGEKRERAEGDTGDAEKDTKRQKQPEETKQNGVNGEKKQEAPAKKGPGRPRKDAASSTAEKKTETKSVPTGDNIGSRTRSKANA
ncbi:hypothetical protein L228DRAFT_246849 [Xylona heveae TC161]|uniref:Hypervirulence associated protein TUDOR domain-containing protein n=1 Tax=Xylona heveae (strain CBS 132557 / TC161) TaxID=1328760 RepID=A0A165GSB9_XYLHT|nr:hypothetical protein L228DRAFT_246849 [Xylona heveae TC161]KZF22532.1 hypothetical protein L228DRAFT_246849 [Xylona heveae TC161]